VHFGETKALIPHLLREGISESEATEMYEGVDENNSGLTSKFSNGVYALWFPEYACTPQEEGVIAHECFHLVEYIFERIGIPLTSDTSESWAHQLQYFVASIKKEL
jgi:hypothetical protein